MPSPRESRFTLSRCTSDSAEPTLSDSVRGTTTNGGAPLHRLVLPPLLPKGWCAFFLCVFGTATNAGAPYRTIPEAFSHVWYPADSVARPSLNPQICNAGGGNSSSGPRSIPDGRGSNPASLRLPTKSRSWANSRVQCCVHSVSSTAPKAQ